MQEDGKKSEGLWLYICYLVSFRLSLVVRHWKCTYILICFSSLPNVTSSVQCGNKNVSLSASSTKWVWYCYQKNCTFTTHELWFTCPRSLVQHGNIKVQHWAPSWTILFLTTSLLTIYLRSILISSHFYFSLPSGLFSRDLFTNGIFIFLVPPPVLQAQSLTVKHLKCMLVSTDLCAYYFFLVI